MPQPKPDGSRKITVPLRVEEIQRILRESEHPPAEEEPLRDPRTIPPSRGPDRAADTG